MIRRIGRGGLTSKVISSLWNHRKQTSEWGEPSNNKILLGTTKSILGHKERNTNIPAALHTGYLIVKQLRQGFKYYQIPKVYGWKHQSKEA